MISYAIWIRWCRADVGIYGGPGNWFWGGEPIPDGSPIITAITDSPQDQGGTVGVLFDKSVWDDNTLENKVTSYSIWRNFDSNGNSIDTITEVIGNLWDICLLWLLMPMPMKHQLLVTVLWLMECLTLALLYWLTQKIVPSTGTQM